MAGVRTYVNNTAGTVDYVNGIITIGAIVITGVGSVDGITSSRVRITAIPNSYDVTPVRNQILEIDTTNTTYTSNVDATASTGVGYSTTTTSSGTTTTSVASVSSTPSSSAY